MLYYFETLIYSSQALWGRSHNIHLRLVSRFSAPSNQQAFVRRLLCAGLCLCPLSTACLVSHNLAFQLTSTNRRPPPACKSTSHDSQSHIFAWTAACAETLFIKRRWKSTQLLFIVANLHCRLPLATCFASLLFSSTLFFFYCNLLYLIKNATFQTTF